jgi:5-dehydro-2-deoxygluconokinase
LTTTFDVICIGRSTLDLFADQIGAAFKDVRSFSAFAGGSPTNICVAASRLGLKTAMITGVGEDYIGGFLLEFLRAEGIDTSHIAFKPGYSTNTVLVALQPPTGMEFVALHHMNADLELTIDDLMAAPLNNTAMLLFTGMCLLKDPSRSATQFAAEFARSAGARVLIDLDYRAPMWPDPRVYGITMRLALPLVDVAIGTEEEVRAAAGTDSLESAAVRVLAGVREALVIKRGARGSSVYLKDGQIIDSPAFPIEVVNFLGAGDAFAGGLITALRQGQPWADAVRFANACGAILASRLGTANVMPRAGEVQAFIDQQRDLAPRSKAGGDASG